MSTASSDAAMSVDDQEQRVPTDAQTTQSIVIATPTRKHNSSYHNAIGNNPHDMPFIDKTPDMNSTIRPSNYTMDDTLTPGGSKLPLSPLPTNLPPPPQFGNEAMTSTPNAPPPYKEAVSRSSLASSFNSNNSNNTSSPVSSRPQSHSSIHQELTTLPSGNNPGNRLSYAHHQPIIFDDEDHLANQHDDRSTPSPTTHLLVLTPDERIEESTGADNSSYDFYERQYKQRQPPHAAADPVKVTFV